jgi:1-acyl-sn-glycerol-3-phosphate acyltransferase
MTFYYLLVRKFLSLLLRIFYGLKIRGIKAGDWQDGALIASNHQSALDPIIVGSAAPPEMFYFAKDEIFTWPVLGFLAKTFNAFPTKRGAFDLEAIRKANSILKQEKNLLLFIEGTRSKDGNLLPAKKGVGMLAIQNRVDIIPAYVYGSFHLRKAFFKFPGLVVSFGDRIKIQDYLSMQLPNKKLYGMISDDVMEQIIKLRGETLDYLTSIKKLH